MTVYATTTLTLQKVVTVLI